MVKVIDIRNSRKRKAVTFKTKSDLIKRHKNGGTILLLHCCPYHSTTGTKRLNKLCF
jgi:hypothetical protein